MMAQTGTITTGSHGRGLATAPDFLLVARSRCLSPCAKVEAQRDAQPVVAPDPLRRASPASAVR